MISGKTEAIWEKWYPWIFASISAMCSYFFNLSTNIITVFLSEITTVAAIFIGFLGTLAGILLTTQSKAVSFMKEIGKLEPVLGYIWGSIRLLFLLIIVSVGLQAIKLPNGSLFSLIWVFIFTVAIISAYRALDISLSLLRSVSKCKD
ncbi:MAG: hypothetical protein FH749_07780 [Firmicutes bacterium]|nr:hypothetical protein [Bacillota bacterium]